MKETERPPTSSQTPSRSARPAPLRRPPVIKSVAASKPARIRVKSLAPVISESTQSFDTNVKTPRQLSASFLLFIEKLKELNWFEEQYPLMKIDVCLCLILIKE